MLCEFIVMKKKVFFVTWTYSRFWSRAVHNFVKILSQITVIAVVTSSVYLTRITPVLKLKVKCDVSWSRKTPFPYFIVVCDFFLLFSGFFNTSPIDGSRHWLKEFVLSSPPHYSTIRSYFSSLYKVRTGNTLEVNITLLVTLSDSIYTWASAI